jgi:hypothetical protein
MAMPFCESLKVSESSNGTVVQNKLNAENKHA